MTKEQALQYKQRWKFVNDFLAKEIRNTQPEVRLRQLRTIMATGHRLHRPDPSRDAGLSIVRERWRILKERFNASN